jgi:outer membrane lipoprotein SlyB
MKTFILKLPAAEVVHLLRAETEAAYGAPELHIAAEKEYIIEEDFDRSAYGIDDGEDFDLVASIAILTIEPRVESGYWILETVVERALGLLRTSQEDELTRRELTLDEFDAELRAAGRKRVSVRLYVETSDVKQDFDRWLGEMQARHPWKTPADLVQASMTEDMTKTASLTYRAKEAVGVFSDPNALEAAVDELEVSGFDRAAVSVLATDARAKDQVDRFYRTVREVEDSGRVPQAAFVSRDSRTEGEAAAVGIPLYVGGFAGAAAVAAAGGALALALAATIAGAVAGAGLGALLAAAIARRHAARVQVQLKKGGLVLWVSVPQPDAEKRALAVLEKMGAKDVHFHEINREWSLGDLPFAPIQPDPFLENDRVLIKRAPISPGVKKRGNR